MPRHCDCSARTRSWMQRGMSHSADYSATLVMIRESVTGVADRADLQRVRGLRFGGGGFDRATWTSICDLGWIGLRVAETRGGVGLGSGAYCALAEELGAGLAPEPVIGAILAAAFLEGEHLEAQLAGTSLILPAWQKEPSALGPSDGLEMKGGGLFGVRRYVTAAANADAFVVVGQSGAWLVRANDPGLQVDIVETQDGGHFGTLSFDGAQASPLDGDVRGAFADATLATSAYLLGLMDAALERTIDFLKTRVQFGKPIGAFQALQHRAVDLKLQVELSRASVEDAAARWEAAPGALASLAAVSRAKARCGSAAMLVTRQAIQLHGGIGYTDEHDIGLYLRKVMVVAPQFGSVELHRARFAALVSPEGA